MTRADRIAVAAQGYRAAISRLLRGEGRHPKHLGRVVRVTPASVAREARRSRNPLYTTHRDVLTEIEAAVELPAATANVAARIVQLEAANRDLRNDVQRLMREQRALATENLGLLHRAQVAEARLSIRSTASANRN